MATGHDERWREMLLNDDGEDLIYETPGDAQRGNPLDIIVAATCYSNTDVTGFGFPRKPLAKELARRWNAHAALLAACRRALAYITDDVAERDELAAAIKLAEGG